MGLECIKAINGQRPFDVVIENVKIVNVFNLSVMEGSVAWVGDTIACIGEMDFPYTAKETIDGKGRYAIPGLIDSHMHIESSMMAPARFAEIVLAYGTTTVAADPHEIGNVCGVAGVRALTEAAGRTPLHVLMMAPSTIPSAPGLERAGFSVEEKEMEEMLDIPGVYGMGEIMDFNAVADGDERILAVLAAAKKRGVIMDAHISALTGRRLQAFRTAGADADHTDMFLDRAREKLEMGFAIQVQQTFLSAELMAFLNDYPMQDRIMLITDDVPYIELVRNGHLNANVRDAIALGLEPMKAIRYATLNAADRLRLYDRGAVSPGYKADVLLVDSLEEMKPSMVFSDGKLVAENGKCLVRSGDYSFPEEFYRSIHVLPLEAADLVMKTGEPGAARALVNTIACGKVSTRTQREEHWVPVKGGVLQPAEAGLMKMAIVYRHGYGPEKAPGKEVSLGLISGFPDFKGAIATTYAHDSHNLVVYGADDADMVLAANHLLEMGGGLCAVLNGEVIGQVELPLAGLLSEAEAEPLTRSFEGLFAAVERLGLDHAHPMTFLTLMALAVSLEIKCTDIGLVDVREKKRIPVIIRTE